MNNKVLIAVFDDSTKLIECTKSLVENGYEISDVYSPFAIHGINKLLGIKRSRLTVVAFVFAMLGIVISLCLMIYAGVFDWQMNIGGKPVMALPSFIPITFELSILSIPFGMLGAFFIVNRMFWGKNADIIDLRISDDRFAIAVKTASHQINYSELENLLIHHGAIETKEKIYAD